jgi:MFS family permease
VATVALVLLVSSGHPATAVGGLLIAEAVPGFAAPLLGAVADRVDRRSLMILCELGQALLYAGIAAWLPPYAVLLVFVGCSQVLSRMFSAASKGAIPSLVREDELLSANALINTVFNLQVALGPALGGLLVALSGSRLAIAVDAGTFLASALIMLSLPSLRAALTEGRSGLRAETVEGVRYIWSDTLLRVVLLSMFGFIVFASVDNVALVFLVRDVLHGGSFAYGAVVSAFGLGMIVGALVMVRRFSRVHPAIFVLVGMTFTGAGNLLGGLAPALGFVFFTQLVGGAGNGMGLVGEDTLVQRYVPGHLLGRVFGTISATIFVASTIAYGAGGLLVDATSARTALIISGVGVFAVVAAAWPVLSRAATAAGPAAPPAGPAAG